MRASWCSFIERPVVLGVVETMTARALVALNRLRLHRPARGATQSHLAEISN